MGGLLNPYTFHTIYDNNGNIVSTTDARGISINGTYDNLNRLTLRDYSDTTPDVLFKYDGAGASIPFSKGKTTEVSSSVSVTKYTSFDSLGRIKSSQQLTGGQTYNFADYSYNLSGALVSQVYPSGRVVSNQFENDGDLAQVNGTFQGNNKTYAGNLSYTSAGAVQAMQLGNGRWETAQFNSRLQVTQIGLGTASNTQDLLKLNYDYGTTDNNGSMKSQQITVAGQFVANQTYSYDSLNRLQSATETINSAQTWKQTFQFDRYGNRKFDAAQTTTLGGCPQAVCNPDISTANNRLVGSGYDQAGNVTQDAENKLFFYDAENRQKEARNASNQVVGQYFYDGEGRRVQKTATQENTIFVYDAFGKMVAEYLITAVVSQAPQTRYLTEDHLGSPRVITDQTGGVISRHDYMAFGEEISRANYGTDTIRDKYTGYERDTESNLDYAQARYYNSKNGRFTSVDPLTASASIKNPQTFNRYSYGLNSPYKFTDPLGLQPTLMDRAKAGLLTEREMEIIRWNIANKTPFGLSILRNTGQNSQPANTNTSENTPPPEKRTVAFLNRAKKATKEVAQFESGMDLLSQLTDLSELGLIDEIIVHSHGFEGGIIAPGFDQGLYRMEYYDNSDTIQNFIGPPSAANTSDFARRVESGSVRISQGGSIVLFGCNNSNLAQELSAKLGAVGRGDISVTGANNSVYPKNSREAGVDRLTYGISRGAKGSFITYRNGITVTTSSTRSYK